MYTLPQVSQFHAAAVHLWCLGAQQTHHHSHPVDPPTSKTLPLPKEKPLWQPYKCPGWHKRRQRCPNKPQTMQPTCRDGEPRTNSVDKLGCINTACLGGQYRASSVDLLRVVDSCVCYIRMLRIPRLAGTCMHMCPPGAAMP